MCQGKANYKNDLPLYSARAENMVKEFQLFLKGLEGRTTIIWINEDASIKELRELISEKTSMKLGVMRLLYCSKELRDTDKHNNQQFLKDYKIENEANIFIVLRLRGGSDRGKPNKPEPRRVDIVASNNTSTTLTKKKLDSDVELTSEPDMITLDKDEIRAKMPCGHAIGPESLTVFCRSLLESGKYELRCPHMDPSYCGQLWDFYTVKKIGVLSKAERTEFEKQIAINFLRQDSGIQDCPRCQSYCERLNRNDVRVICPLCSEKANQLFEFCWFCLKEWSTSSIRECGNPNCSGVDPKMKILRDCQEKDVVGVRCPAVRACPKCGLLIEHITACKQMECQCGQKFCFICLKMANAGGQYTCGAWNTKCKKAPLQTQLP